MTYAAPTAPSCLLPSVYMCTEWGGVVRSRISVSDVACLKVMPVLGDGCRSVAGTAGDSICMSSGKYLVIRLILESSMSALSSIFAVRGVICASDIDRGVLMVRKPWIILMAKSLCGYL